MSLFFSMEEIEEDMNVHDRNEDDVNERRNVRQRQPHERFEPFNSRVDISVQNINIYQGDRKSTRLNSSHP